jgi:serine/threonine protein kinase
MKIKIIKENKKDFEPKHNRIPKQKNIPKDDSNAYIAKMLLEKGELKELEETSTAGGGMTGYAGSPLGTQKDNEEFNDKQKKESELKGDRMVEMFSTSTQTGGIRISIVSPEEEHAGHVERSHQQGLRNVMMEVDDDTTIDSTKPIGDAPPIPIEKDPITAALENNGYIAKKKLGEGQYGVVMLAQGDGKNKNKLNYAIKILKSGEHSSSAIDREVRNYTEISKARSEDPLIADHFPEVEEIFVDQGLTFIVMEVLVPLHDELKSLLRGQEALIKKYYNQWASEKAIRLFDKSKDVSKRVVTSLRDERQLSKLLRNVKRSILMSLEDNDINLSDSLRAEIDKNINSGAVRNWERADSSAVRKYVDSVEKYIINFIGDASNSYMATMDDMKKSPFATFFVAYISKKTTEIITKNVKDPKVIGKVLTQVLSGFQDTYRQSSPIKGGYKPSDFPKIALGGDKRIPKEVRSIVGAIKKLSEETGLFARDLHDLNIMRRPGGDLVIVDVGMFKTNKEIQQMFKRGLKEGSLRENRLRIRIKR